MAANNYFVFTDWRQAVDNAKCCIAKKQAAQVGRESNLMGRCPDIDSEIAFLQSTLILLNNYTYEGDYNQITDEECLELIQRVETICNCKDEKPYAVNQTCGIVAICVGGTYQESGSDAVTITNQTVTPNLDCVFVFEMTDPVLGVLTYVLQEVDGVWQLTNDGNLLDTAEKVNATYTFLIGTTSYSLTANVGACS